METSVRAIALDSCVNEPKSAREEGKREEGVAHNQVL